jgi:hypothetical protein
MTFLEGVSGVESEKNSPGRNEKDRKEAEREKGRGHQEKVLGTNWELGVVRWN